MGRRGAGRGERDLAFLSLQAKLRSGGELDEMLRAALTLGGPAGGARGGEPGSPPGGGGGDGRDAVEEAVARAWEVVGGEQPEFARCDGEESGDYLHRVLEVLLVPSPMGAGPRGRSPWFKPRSPETGRRARTEAAALRSPSVSPRSRGSGGGDAGEGGGEAGSPGTSPRSAGVLRRGRPDPLWMPAQSRGGGSPQSSAGGSPRGSAGAGSRRGSAAKLEGGVEDRLRSETMARFASRMNRQAHARSEEARERVLRQKRETVLGTGVSRRRELGSATKEAFRGKLRRARGRSGLEREVEDPAGAPMRKLRSVVEVITANLKQPGGDGEGLAETGARKREKAAAAATVTAARPPRSPSPTLRAGRDPERHESPSGKSPLPQRGSPRSNGGTPTAAASPGDELAGKLLARKKRTEWPPPAEAGESDAPVAEQAPARKRSPPCSPVSSGQTPTVATGTSSGHTSRSASAAGRRESTKNAAFLEAAALFAKAAGGPLRAPVDKGWGLEGRRTSSREGSPSP